MIIKEFETIPNQRKSARFEKSGKKYLTSYIPHENANIYSVIHETYYRYQSTVHFSNHLFRLQPVTDSYQSLISFKMSTTPGGKVGSFVGVFGNQATFLEIRRKYKELKIISQSIVSVSEKVPKQQDLKLQPKIAPLVLMPWDHVMLQAYLMPPELPESMLLELSNYALKFVKKNDSDALRILNDINQTIFREFSYVPGSTNLFSTPYEVYFARKGVCADFANLFICLARLLNIPARYRVGYIYTGGNYKNKIQSDESHAWVEIYLPYFGWIGYDPTNGCMAGKHHIRVACGRHYLDATPSSGTIFKGGEGGEKLKTSVQVELLNLSHSK